MREHPFTLKLARGPALNPEQLTRRQQELAQARVNGFPAPALRSTHLAASASAGPDGSARWPSSAPGLRNPFHLNTAPRRAPARPVAPQPRQSRRPIPSAPQSAPPTPNEQTSVAPASLTTRPALWYRLARRFAPGIAPPLMGSLLLVAVAFLSARRDGVGVAATSPGSLLSLFIVYLVGGVIYGYLLYRASTPLWFESALLGGAACYLLAAAFIVGGALAAAFTLALLVALFAYYARNHLRHIPDQHVVVTTFAGVYHRTLKQGNALLAPGERMAATLDLTERQFTTPTRSIELTGPDGEQYTAQAAATVGYAVIPALARLAALATRQPEQWEREINALIAEALDEALSRWGADLLEQHAAGDAHEADHPLAPTLLDLLRPEARAFGVHITWARLANIWLAAHAPSTRVGAAVSQNDTTIPPQADDWLNSPHPAAPANTWVAASLAPTVMTTFPVGSPAFHGPSYGPPASLPAIGAAGDLYSAQGPSAIPLTDLSAEALSDAYDAVRAGHINDPATIRSIADAFLRVAGEPTLNDTFPYDALAAARILLERAATVERGQWGPTPLAPDAFLPAAQATPQTPQPSHRAPPSPSAFLR